jgi:hypothetical protein
VVPLNSLFRGPQLLLHNLCFYPEIRELVSQALILYSQTLTFLFPDFDFLVQHHRPFDCHVVLRVQILQGGRCVARLALKVIVLHFDIPQFEL